MKKSTLLIIILSLVLCLAACSRGKSAFDVFKMSEEIGSMHDKKDEKTYKKSDEVFNENENYQNSAVNKKTLKVSEAFSPKRDGVWFLLDDGPESAGINSEIKKVFIFDKGKSYYFNRRRSLRLAKLGDVSKLLSKTKSEDQLKAVYDFFKNAYSANTKSRKGDYITNEKYNFDLVDPYDFLYNENYRKDTFDLMRKNKAALFDMAKAYISKNKNVESENLSESLYDEYIDILERKFPTETDKILYAYLVDKTGNNMVSEQVVYRTLYNKMLEERYFTPYVDLTIANGFDLEAYKKDDKIYGTSLFDAYNAVKESTLKEFVEGFKDYDEIYYSGFSGNDEKKSFSYYNDSQMVFIKPIKEITGGKPIVVYDNEFDGYTTALFLSDGECIVTLNDDSVNLILNNKDDEDMVEKIETHERID